MTVPSMHTLRTNLYGWLIATKHLDCEEASPYHDTSIGRLNEIQHPDNCLSTVSINRYGKIKLSNLRKYLMRNQYGPLEPKHLTTWGMMENKIAKTRWINALSDSHQMDKFGCYQMAWVAAHWRQLFVPSVKAASRGSSFGSLTGVYSNIVWGKQLTCYVWYITVHIPFGRASKHATVHIIPPRYCLSNQGRIPWVICETNGFIVDFHCVLAFSHISLTLDGLGYS